MSLEAGQRLAHYEILEPIGKGGKAEWRNGGMGEVYRARDTKLGRDVAIKVLPEEFSRDKERLDRFKREARLLAQLNHANIATLYGLEEHEGQLFLVMELVGGETLAERIARGPIPVKEAIPLFIQIAAGLEAAHEKGIIHRDLKPANVKIGSDGKPKILDFGLAKAFVGERDSAADSQSPTLTKGTALGVILGTASYMSPEQARGKAVDKRTDIWAFGCCFYEVLTGTKAFPGETVTDALAAIVHEEPDFKALPPAVPARVRELLERCLAKDATERLRDIGDTRFDLRAARRAPSVSKAKGKRSSRQYVGLVLVGLVAASVAGTLGYRLSEVAPPAIRRFTIPLDGLLIGGALTIARDGSRIAYVTGTTLGADTALHVRSLAELAARIVPDSTEGAVAPAFSPDGTWLAFGFGVNRRELMKYSIESDATIEIGEFVAGPQGVGWGNDDTIYYSEIGGRAMKVPAAGGEPEPVIVRDDGSAGLYWPDVMRGGRGVLYTLLTPYSDRPPSIMWVSPETVRCVSSSTTASMVVGPARDISSSRGESSSWPSSSTRENSKCVALPSWSSMASA